METLLAGITSITMGQIVMMLIGAILIYLGIKERVRTYITSAYGTWYHLGQLPRDRRSDPNGQRN